MKEITWNWIQRTTQEIMEKLNKLEITDFNFEDGVYHSIYARKNEDLSNLLWTMAMSGDELDLMDHTENSIDISSIAKDFKIEFDGTKFVFEEQASNE